MDHRHGFIRRHLLMKAWSKMVPLGDSYPRTTGKATSREESWIRAGWETAIFFLVEWIKESTHMFVRGFLFIRNLESIL